MSVTVHITFLDVLLSAPLVATIEGCTSCDSPLFPYLIRQQLLVSKNVLPFEQIIVKSEDGITAVNARLQIDGFYTMQLRVREAQNLRKLTIHGHAHNEYDIFVDDADTVLDVKFLLSPLINAKAEHIQLNYNTMRRLSDDETVGGSTLVSDEIVLMWWLEYPNAIPGESPVFRSRSTLLTTNPLYPDIGRTIREVFAQNGDAETFGVRTFLDANDFSKRGAYKYTTFQHINDRITRIASAFRALGLKPGQNTKIGMCSGNRPEWLLCDFACQVQSIVTVPLYPTLDKNAIEYIVNHAEISLVVCSADVIEEVYDAKQHCPYLQYIVLMDDQLPEQMFAQKHRNTDAQMYDYLLSELEALGRKEENLSQYADIYPSDPDSDICTIMYTSGTTGNPKGVLTTHSNLMATMNEQLQLDFSEELFITDSVHLSYLPLAHVYERVVNVSALIRSAKVSFWSGDIDNILDDMALVKPRIFFGVPRIYQKFQDRMLAGIADQNFIIRWLFKKLYDSKLSLLRKRKLDLIHKNAPGAWKCWFDRIFQPKFRAVFGGVVQFGASGSAPLSKELSLFLNIVLFDAVIEGYGLTESCASGTGTTDLDLTFGHVGQPRGNVELKLVSVPDMNYNTTDKPYARGEIWMRGAAIFKGYYKNAAKTREVLTADGWFKTGDIGLWRSEGRLVIIDRKKNIFKLAQGEYIRPEYIQNVYKMSRYIDQIFVYGNSLQTYLVAVIIPDFETLATMPAFDSANIENSAEFQQLLEADMKIQEEIGGLKGFEKVKKFIIETEQFTVENGLTTISMKLKRPVVRAKYKQVLDSLYTIQSKL